MSFSNGVMYESGLGTVRRCSLPCSLTLFSMPQEGGWQSPDHLRDFRRPRSPTSTNGCRHGPSPNPKTYSLQESRACTVRKVQASSSHATLQAVS